MNNHLRRHFKRCSTVPNADAQIEDLHITPQTATTSVYAWLTAPDSIIVGTQPNECQISNCTSLRDCVLELTGLNLGWHQSSHFSSDVLPPLRPDPGSAKESWIARRL